MHRTYPSLFKYYNIRALRALHPSPSRGVWWAFGSPLWSFGPPIWPLVHPYVPSAHSLTAFYICHHRSSWYVIFYFWAKFYLSTMIISVSRTPHPRSHTWRTLDVPDWILGGWGHSWHHGSSGYVIFYLCANSQFWSMIRSLSRIHRPRSNTWRMLKVPDCILRRWGHSWHHGLSWCVILDLCSTFHLSSMNIIMSRTPCPRCHTWRTLMVADLILGGWGHSWHHGLSWYVILDLCAKFQLSSMNKILSRTPHTWSSHTWMMLKKLQTINSTIISTLNDKMCLDKTTNQPKVF